MQDYVGKHIDRYRVIERLGTGGMAVVYKAYDTRLERDVALKLIRTTEIPQSQHERLMKRFEREAKSQARFSHPNIIAVHDYGEVDGAPYLVMEYIMGGTLKERLIGPVDYRQAISWVVPIADALAYAHERNTIHRDVKPSNILIDENNRPILTDFGIAKLLETDEATLTGTGMGVGTPEYMAPEQWRGQATPATDQYALGVVLYELLTGHKPYTADTPAAVAIMQAMEPLQPPGNLVPGIPGSLEKLLYKALALRPEDRFEDMGAFKGALERELKSTPDEAKPVQSKQPSQPIQEKPAVQSISEAETIDALEPTPPELPDPTLKSSPGMPVEKQVQKKEPFPSWVLWAGGILTLVIGVILGSGFLGRKPAPAAATKMPVLSPTYTKTYIPTHTQVKHYKIGIVTGTVSQGEEEYQEAMNQIAKYGDMIVHATYPDNFPTETETTISQVVQVASDPEVKAIVFVQAVPGAAAAIEKVRETRPDMLFVAGVPAEDPAVISEKADIVMRVDEISMGLTIPEKAFEMGAKTFIHYSFPRHLSYATIALRLEIMRETAAELGMELVEVNAPDPNGDAGVYGAQQFIIEDVPRQVEKYGVDTAFFSTSCSMQEPLIRTIWELGAIYPQQCCPSPYHGYPAGLNIDVSGHEGDVDFMLEQIQARLKEKGQEGRMSTWGVPIKMLMIDAGVRYAIKFAEGKVTNPRDVEAFKATLNEAAAARGVGDVEVTAYYDDAGTIENFLQLLCPFHDFSE